MQRTSPPHQHHATRVSPTKATLRHFFSATWHSSRLTTSSLKALCAVRFPCSSFPNLSLICTRRLSIHRASMWLRHSRLGSRHQSMFCSTIVSACLLRSKSESTKNVSSLSESTLRRLWANINLEASLWVRSSSLTPLSTLMKWTISVWLRVYPAFSSGTLTPAITKTWPNRRRSKLQSSLSATCSVSKSTYKKIALVLCLWRLSCNQWSSAMLWCTAMLDSMSAVSCTTTRDSASLWYLLPLHAISLSIRITLVCTTGFRLLWTSSRAKICFQLV